MNDITFALTSCGRFDLLEKTIDSFIKYNTYPIKKYYIVEDSQNKDIFNIQKKYSFIDIIFNEEKLGQIKSIDKMYNLIDTDYIFHCEDDWEFTNGGFMEKSMEILENYPNIFQVWIRDKKDHQHPLLPKIYELNGIKYQEQLPLWQGIYSGFSFNPSLRRKKDYNLIKPYEKIGGETRIGLVYNKLNFKFMSLTDGYCKHIGQNNHVNDPQTINNKKAYYNFDIGDVNKYVNR